MPHARGQSRLSATLRWCGPISAHDRAVIPLRTKFTFLCRRKVRLLRYLPTATSGSGTKNEGAEPWNRISMDQHNKRADRVSIEAGLHSRHSCRWWSRALAWCLWRATTVVPSTRASSMASLTPLLMVSGWSDRRRSQKPNCRPGSGYDRSSAGGFTILHSNCRSNGGE